MSKNNFQNSLHKLQDNGAMAWEDFTRKEVTPLNKKTFFNQTPVTENESFQTLYESETSVTPTSVNTKTKVVFGPNKSIPNTNIPTCNVKAKQKLKKGQLKIEEQCDLHGCTEDQARHQLFRFVKEAQNSGKKLVLVITGKGKNSQNSLSFGNQGILKQRVPGWLNSDKFTPYVISHFPANKNQGGDGALYVRIRKKR